MTAAGNPRRERDPAPPDLAARTVRHRRAGPRGHALRSTSSPARSSACGRSCPSAPPATATRPTSASPPSRATRCSSAWISSSSRGCSTAADVAGASFPRDRGRLRRGRSTSSSRGCRRPTSAARDEAGRHGALRRLLPREGRLAGRLRALHGGEGGPRERGLDGVGRPTSGARKPKALERWRREKAEAVRARQFAQFLFFSQWAARARRPAATRHRRSWATSRSSSPTTARTSGPIPISSASRRTARPRSWPACRPTTSAPPASSGATPSIAGTRWRARGYRLVGRPLPRHASRWWTSCASTTSAASRPTGRSRPARRRRCTGSG